jgi:hypothetical protein
MVKKLNREGKLVDTLHRLSLADLRQSAITARAKVAQTRTDQERNAALAGHSVEVENLNYGRLEVDINEMFPKRKLPKKKVVVEEDSGES